MRQAQRWIVVSAAVLSLAAVCLGQSAPAKKSYTFHGKVEAVNAATIKVNGRNRSTGLVARRPAGGLCGTAFYAAYPIAVRGAVGGRGRDPEQVRIPFC